MPITAPTPVAPGPAVPTSTDAEATFDAAYEAFNTWEKNELQPGMNALAANVHSNATQAHSDATTAADAAVAAAASQAAAESASTATAWVSGTGYTAGQVRYSPINFQAYRRTTSGAGAIDPSADPTNWAALGLSANGAATLTNKALGAGTTFTSDALARIQATALCF